MKIVIDIPEKDYNEIEPFLNGEIIKGGFNLFRVLEVIKNGTPLQTFIHPELFQEGGTTIWLENGDKLVYYPKAESEEQ